MHDVILDTVLANGSPDVYQAFLGSLLSGIFGRKDAKRAARLAEEAAKVPLVSTNVANLAEMNKQAIANGYNPMTILNAGGLSAFSTTTTTGHNAMAAAQARGAVPSFGSVLTGAIGKTIDSITGSLFKSALPASAGMGASYFPPAPSADFGMAGALGWNTGSTVSAQRGGAIASPAFKSSRLATNAGAPMLPAFDRPQTVNPWVQYGVDPSTGGAEPFAQRYGESELVETIAGVYAGWDDIWYNVTGMTSQERYKAMGQPVAKVANNAFDSVKAGVLARNPKKDVLSFGKAAFEFFEPWMGP